MEILLFLLAVGLLFYLAYREYIAASERQQDIIERKDLLDRLMARNFVEYKEQTQEIVETEEEPDSLIDLADAKEELLDDKED